ncbi:MAG: phosphate ABC transporter substrate-binding protein PstS [Nitrospirae bacterium]|nr:phosphate ABC transporter substrate-binding protein PstS [Nitrospirota bacterium]MBI5694639.1 phosphate ABC transporter substrate-binding protein PstS [Nitrospirota bacterium]
MEDCMKKVLLLALTVLALTAGAAQAGITLNGAGATFPYPLYSKWFYNYEKQTGTRVNYQSIGSGGGISQVKAGTVDFGASDAPLKAKELREANLFQFPMVAGAVAVVYNLPGVGSGLKLKSQTVADIYLGKIKKWNDPAIVKDNPGVNLSAMPIIVAHRSDGSGTTNIFTWYLEDVSSQWKLEVGSGKAVKWPVGIGGKGNEGVAGVVRQTKGAIGYVELAYATENKITYATLGNRDGGFVAPSTEGCIAAAASAKVPDDYYARFTYAPGKDSYPISGFTYLLVPRNLEPSNMKAFAGLVGWAFEKGDKDAKALHYVPIPDKLKDRIKADLKKLAK